MNLQFNFLQTTKELGLDIVRMYLGFALISQGYYFMTNLNELFELTSTAISYGDFIISHYIVFAHLVGGLCIATGLLTRIAVMANLPILLGAITLVHLDQSALAPTSGFEYSLFIFFLLCVSLYNGSGKLSLDYVIDNPKASDEYRDNILQFKKQFTDKEMDVPSGEVETSDNEREDKENKEDSDKAA